MALLTMYAAHKQLNSEKMMRHSQAANDIKINLVSLSFATAIRSECNWAAVCCRHKWQSMLIIEMKISKIPRHKFDMFTLSSFAR